MRPSKEDTRIYNIANGKNGASLLRMKLGWQTWNFLAQSNAPSFQYVTISKFGGIPKQEQFKVVQPPAKTAQCVLNCRPAASPGKPAIKACNFPSCLWIVLHALGAIADGDKSPSISGKPIFLSSSMWSGRTSLVGITSFSCGLASSIKWSKPGSSK